MSLVGQPLTSKPGRAVAWPVGVPAGAGETAEGVADGDTQLIAVFYGLGAAATPGVPAGWQQWGSKGHDFEDVSVTVFTRLLDDAFAQGPVPVVFDGGEAVGIAIAATFANVDLIDPPVLQQSNGPFLTEYKLPDVTVPEDAIRVDFVARKDSREMVSWPNMQLLGDGFVGDPDNASGSAAYKAAPAGTSVGDTIQIRHAYGNTQYDSAPFVSVTLLLRTREGGTAGPPLITASGTAQFPVSIGVKSITAPAIPNIALGATHQYVVTVIGTDNAPMGGQSVTLSLPTALSADSTTKVTDENGQVTFTLSGNFAGSGQVTVLADSKSASRTATVTGPKTTATADLADMVVGGTLTLNITAIDAAQAPIAAQEVSLSVTGPNYTTLTAAAFTDENGQLVYKLRPEESGSMQITATVSGTDSPPVTVIVRATTDGQPLTETDVKDALENPVDPKYTNEKLLYVFDFTQEISPNEHLVEVERAEVLLRSDDASIDPNPNAMLSGDPVIAQGGYVAQYLQGGVPGQTYIARIRARTSFDQTIHQELRVRVYAKDGRRVERV